MKLDYLDRGTSALLAPETEVAPLLGIVVPTLREAENIENVIEHLRSVIDPICAGYEILVVDDDSRDGTDAIVEAIAAQDPRVRFVLRRGERGLSGAILHGWAQTPAPVVGVIDADLQHPPDIFRQLIEAMDEGYDLAIASRYVAGGDLGKWNSVRKFISAAAIWVTWPLQRRGAKAKDPMSGFFLVRHSCLGNAKYQRTGFKLLLEILVRGEVRSVKEIPFTFGLRERGASKASLKVAWDYGILLVKLYWNRFVGGPRQL